MSGTMLITVSLFVAGLLIGFFKWLHGLVVSIKELAVRFDERTLGISVHLSRIDSTLKTLANADMRISNLEDTTNDHEGRLRGLEGAYGERTTHHISY